jgi:kynureninase
MEHVELREDAYRLANGTPAIIALYAIQPGVAIIAQVGVDAIRQKSLRQTALLIDRADALGWMVRSPRQADQRAGTVTLHAEHDYEVSRELIARGFVVDYREGAGIRFAPHFYTSDAEIHQALEAMAAILHDGSWQRHAQTRSFVT